MVVVTLIFTVVIEHVKVLVVVETNGVIVLAITATEVEFEHPELVTVRL